jgi:hypothetical protein
LSECNHAAHLRMCMRDMRAVIRAASPDVQAALARQAATVAATEPDEQQPGKGACPRGRALLSRVVIISESARTR